MARILRVRIPEHIRTEVVAVTREEIAITDIKVPRTEIFVTIVTPILVILEVEIVVLKKMVATIVMGTANGIVPWAAAAVVPEVHGLSRETIVGKKIETIREWEVAEEAEVAAEVDGRMRGTVADEEDQEETRLIGQFPLQRTNVSRSSSSALATRVSTLANMRISPLRLPATTYQVTSHP